MARCTQTQVIVNSIKAWAQCTSHDVIYILNNYNSCRPLTRRLFSAVGYRTVKKILVEKNAYRFIVPYRIVQKKKICRTNPRPSETTKLVVILVYKRAQLRVYPTCVLTFLVAAVATVTCTQRSAIVIAKKRPGQKRAKIVLATSHLGMKRVKWLDRRNIRFKRIRLERGDIGCYELANLLIILLVWK